MQSELDVYTIDDLNFFLYVIGVISSKDCTLFWDMVDIELDKLNSEIPKVEA